MFWNVLKSFNDNSRSAFLRFVWARSRLPPTANSFHQKFKLQLAPLPSISEQHNQSIRKIVDQSLPQAHTCFFSLTLPTYSSESIMNKQLLYAIENCLEMDADFRLAESEMHGWTPR